MKPKRGSDATALAAVDAALAICSGLNDGAVLADMIEWKRD
jgi:hypothetical protein